MGTATTPTGLEYPLHHGETFHTPMGTATAVGETLRARHEKHFISLWGQQLVALCMSTNRSRNISYPYGDSNHREIVHVNVIPETFHTPMGTATSNVASSMSVVPKKHFISPWGQQRLEFFRGCVRDRKHFIPLWGQKENRYVQLDISVFTLSALVIHMLRRPYRAPF